MKTLELFIIGMPRSGTKLLRELINNHQDVYIPDIETLFIPHLLRKFESRKLNEEQVNDVIEELKNSLFFFYYLKDHSFDFNNLHLNGITIKELINKLFAELAEQEGSKASILGDKSPNYIQDINLLLQYYPTAKFIHIVRDPRDYALSVNKAWKKNMMRATHRWVVGVSKIQQLPQEQNKQVMEVKYEALIENPQEILSAICEFLGIPFSRELTSIRRQVEKVGDAKSLKVLAGNHGKFHKQLSARKIEAIEKLTILNLKHYNYPYSTKSTKNLLPTRQMLFYWQMNDGLNLALFNFKAHGIKNGLKKIIKAIKHR